MVASRADEACVREADCDLPIVFKTSKFDGL